MRLGGSRFNIDDKLNIETASLLGLVAKVARTEPVFNFLESISRFRFSILFFKSFSPFLIFPHVGDASL